MRFMAIARASCASLLMEPYDMAPVLKRAVIASTGSTSSSGTGAAAGLNANSPRRVASRSDWSSISRAYSLNVA